VRDTLFLFTYTYPYGAAESFLETEIEYLAAAWTRIVVFPARLEDAPRPVPANAKVETGLARMLGKGIGAAALVGVLADPDFRREVIRRPGVLVSAGHLRRLVGQIAVARSTARWVEDYILRTRTDRRRLLCYSYWLNLPALGLARLRRSGDELIFVSRAHGYDLYAERHDPPYLPLQPEPIRWAKAVFTTSEHGRSYLAGKYPGLESRIEVSRLGVVDPGAGSDSSTDGRWRVLSCSGFLPVKRLDALVRGLAELARRHPERTIEWNHLGDGPLRARIEELARARLPANVEWTIHGQLSNAAVMEYYRSHPADVFVNVSESEGIPVSIMEAQSFGVPVVATAVGGVPEIVDDSNGILLEPLAEDVGIADAIERVCVGSGLAARLREGSRATWRARYDAETNYTAFVRRLRKIQESPPEGIASPPSTRVAAE
jgi:glycosyltransferase involved in cell wall biosynthesis